MDSKRIEFHEHAAAEYEAAIDWYFERSPVAAQKICRRNKPSDRKRRKKSPKMACRFNGYSQVFLRHFPFAVIYREQPSVIQILAIAHGHRRPDYWKRRL